MAINFSNENIKYLSVLYAHERHNSYVYSKISNYLNVLGYKNLSKYYEDWSQHEIEHSIKVREFCNNNNLNIDMTIQVEGIDEKELSSSLVSFVNITLDVENKTSDMYNVLLEMGEEDGNGFIKKFAYDFLQEQIEETDKALSIKDSIQNIGENKALLQLFDNSFEYEN